MTAKTSFQNNVEITAELVSQHGLKPDEYERFEQLIGRKPTLTELGIVSAMWNEHCSYKSSKKWLKTLPTSGEKVIQGPGENLQARGACPSPFYFCQRQVKPVFQLEQRLLIRVPPAV